MTQGAKAQRLSIGRIVLFALASLPVSALATALLIYLPPHLATQLGVPLAVVAGTWATVRFIDIGVDPVLGVLMDHTRTAIGRYRPWMILGTPMLMLAVGMLFFAPVGVGMGYLVGWLFVLYVALSILALAHPAWAATLAKGYHDRSRIFGIMAAVAILALLAVLSIPVIAGRKGLGDAGAVHAMGWFVILLSPVAIGLAVLFTPERLAPRHHSDTGFHIGDVALVLRKPALLRLYAAQMAMTMGPGWMSSIYIFFTRDYMGFSQAQASMLLLVYVLAGLGGAPFAAWLSTKIGKHRTVMLIAVTYSLGLITVLLAPKGVLLGSVPVNLWCGFSGAGFELTIRSMLADVADEVRLDHGKDRLSLIYSLNTAAAKLASAGAIIVSFQLLGRFGYVAKVGHHNTPEAIQGLGITFVSGPIACVILGALFMIGWKMTAEKHAAIRVALEARDAEAALGGADGEHLGDVAEAMGGRSVA